MNPSMQQRLLLIAMAGFALLLGWGICGLPAFGQHLGQYAAMLTRVAVAERHLTNVVAAVNFDYRALDTMGEEFILFAAVAGVALLLRAQRAEREQQAHDEAPGRAVPDPSDAVQVTGLALISIAILWGANIIVHGHVTPGGGFQGGVLLATAILLIYLAGEHSLFRRFTPIAVLQMVEAIGVGGYVLMGVAGMLTGVSFLQNPLPLGRTGELYGGGMVPLLNVAVGLAVGAGFVVLLADFIEQTLVLRRWRKP